MYSGADCKPSWFTTFNSKTFHLVILNAIQGDIILESRTLTLNVNRLGLELLIKKN